MLTKFLLLNSFPLSCFYTPWGALQSYFLKSPDKITGSICGESKQKTINIDDIQIVEINPYLFDVHIKIYKQILKDIKKQDLIDYIAMESQKPTLDWESKLKNNIINSLSHNDLFQSQVMGILLNNSTIGREIPKGEGVYITKTTTTQYSIKTVDNMTFNVPHSHLELKTTDNAEKRAEKWKTILKNIEDEYKKFYDTNK